MIRAEKRGEERENKENEGDNKQKKNTKHTSVPQRNVILSVNFVARPKSQSFKCKSPSICHKRKEGRMCV